MPASDILSPSPHLSIPPPLSLHLSISLLSISISPPLHLPISPSPHHFPQSHSFHLYLPISSLSIFSLTPISLTPHRNLHRISAPLSLKYP